MLQSCKMSRFRVAGFCQYRASLSSREGLVEVGVDSCGDGSDLCFQSSW